MLLHTLTKLLHLLIKIIFTSHVLSNVSSLTLHSMIDGLKL